MFERMRKLIGVLLLVSLFTLGVYKPFQEYIQIPESITLFEGQEQSFAKAGAVTVSTASSEENVGVVETEQAFSLQGKNARGRQVNIRISGFSS